MQCSVLEQCQCINKSLCTCHQTAGVTQTSPDIPSWITWRSCVCHWGATRQPFWGPPQPVVYVTQLLPVSLAPLSSLGLLRLLTPRSPAVRHILTALKHLYSQIFQIFMCPVRTLHRNRNKNQKVHTILIHVFIHAACGHSQVPHLYH